MEEESTKCQLKVYGPGVLLPVIVVSIVRAWQQNEAKKRDSRRKQYLKL
jgi:hypothetical protein